MLGDATGERVHGDWPGRMVDGCHSPHSGRRKDTSCDGHVKEIGARSPFDVLRNPEKIADRAVCTTWDAHAEQ